MHNAVIRGHYDMIDVLMENGADINTTDKLGENTLTPTLAVGLSEAHLVLIG